MVSLMRKHLSKDLKDLRRKTWVHLRDLCKQRKHAWGLTSGCMAEGPSGRGTAQRGQGARSCRAEQATWRILALSVRWKEKQPLGLLEQRDRIPIFPGSHWLLGRFKDKGRAELALKEAVPIQARDSGLHHNSSSAGSIRQVWDVSCN